jgi:L-amino acid N-acyltransferase YncA
MQVRDAVEADAEELATQTGAPRDVMRNLVHDRTVRVAITDDSVHGFISFDARHDTVHITQIEGGEGICEQLLEEPIRFAHKEGMAVELLVAESNEETKEAAENVGFEQKGYGPSFEGTRTVKYRLEHE